MKNIETKLEEATTANLELQANYNATLEELAYAQANVDNLELSLEAERLRADY